MSRPDPESEPDQAKPVAIPADNQAEARSTAKAFGLVTIAILCSRVLGLVREVVLNSLFGGTANVKWLDCFIMAFKAPNMLRDLFAEGALSTAFVTVFSKKMKAEGDDSAWGLARKMATLTAVFMSVVSLLGVIFAPVIIYLLAHGWHTDDPEKYHFTILLARIMYPFILLVSLAALVMGMLNARKVFFMPAMSSTFFNLGSMVTGGAIGWWLDPEFGRVAIIGFAIGTLIGGLCQLLILLPSLKKVGFHFFPDFNWRDSGVRNILKIMGPAVISGSVVQVNVLFNTMFASYVELDGSVTALNNAFRLMQLPLGLFGVGLATVSLPALARLATDGVSAEFRGTLSKNLRFVSLLSLPSAVGLIMLAEPIMSIIYGHGAAATNPMLIPMCAIALQAYALGLLFYAALKVLQPAFYAIDRRYIPMFVSLACVLLSVGLNYLFVIRWRLGHEYLALSTSITAALNFCLLFFFMRRSAGGLHDKQLFIAMMKLLISAAAMAGVCWVAKVTVLADWDQFSLWMRGIYLGGTISIAAAVYFTLNLLLGNEEAGAFASILKRRLIRK
ncbi:murein biosynthesis integral membrane protein MurJ [Phragmitibacter flavus]|uniref:Probable lipid II flippase MurJ n=1 Tax=Phragmitibacter flavus TaxID=2576071 RepID=A0A5R8KK47_9BACT|nr:murein biosynthesis integral membrane protein MurJ [Phragmitibacter flavus]TLD71989.1 murein biosynthesis integral membrane protein MurJ [Phragmitibacter flavus]